MRSSSGVNFGKPYEGDKWKKFCPEVRDLDPIFPFPLCFDTTPTRLSAPDGVALGSLEAHSVLSNSWMKRSTFSENPSICVHVP